MKRITTTVVAMAMCAHLWAQNLPNQWTLDESAHRITVGNVDDDGLYDRTVIREYYLDFTQTNYWTQLTNNYGTENEVQATLTVDGVSYPQVGVSFKGQTSYMMAQGEKKSFSIKMDSFIPDQNLMGYQTLNLNNSFQDASFMREFLYLSLIRKHIPAAKVCYVHLFINGEDWGIYPSVQQMNKDYLEEWFLSNDGDNWRADAPTSSTGGGPGGGGGPQWGDGTAALNYNGSTAADYNTYYTLKSQGIDEPWQHLINTCDILENTPIASLTDQLPAVLDVDRALWFLACEIAFGDDDSYVYKGKMDYYAYWELETGRMTPLEYDGNSILGNQANTWGPFYHADNANYPLLYRLMQVPAYRQRYLAHLRTVLEESINLTQTQAFIDEWGAFIDALVESDPKKLTTYNQFVSEKTVLQQRLTARRNALTGKSEMNTIAAITSDVKLYTSDIEWQLPEQNQAPIVKASVSSTDPIASVNLYYATGLVGNFTAVAMIYNGSQYVSELPVQAPGTVVRFYVEVVEGNTAGTRSYNPAGAEHDFYYYFILPSQAPETSVVINEIMASNGGVATDEAGESDDWIELYNPTSEAIDMTGFYLTDNQWNLTKWEIPSGTILNPDSYLIIWADEDGLQGDFHANFKLSSEGETVLLMNNEGEIADAVTYEQQQQNMGYARNPNGTGPFVIQMHTFNANNTLNVSVSENELQGSVEAFPNPFRGNLTISYHQIDSKETSIELVDLSGRTVFLTNGQSLGGNGSITLETNALASGSYILKVRTPEMLITKHLIKN